MVSTKLNKDSQKLFDFVLKNQHIIRNAYKPVTISIHSSLKWICFDLPAHRYPQVIDYIKDNFGENIELRFRPLVFQKEESESKREHLQVFNKSESKIRNLYNFLNRNNICESDPYTRFAPTSKKYHMKWDLNENVSVQEAVERIEHFDHNLNILECHKDKYVNNIKNNAAIALEQVFKYALSKHIASKSKLEDAKSFLVKKLLTTRKKFTPIPNVDFPESNIET